MFGKRDGTGRAGKRRVRIHEVTHENDIRYRGPLNFQHFQILGWLCIAISQIAVAVYLLVYQQSSSYRLFHPVNSI